MFTTFWCWFGYRPPDAKSIKAWYDRLKETGSIADLCRGDMPSGSSGVVVNKKQRVFAQSRGYYIVQTIAFLRNSGYMVFRKKSRRYMLYTLVYPPLHTWVRVTQLLNGLENHFSQVHLMKCHVNFKYLPTAKAAVCTE